MLKFGLDAWKIICFHAPFRFEVHIESSLNDFFPLIFTPKRVISKYYQIVIEGTV